MTMMPAHCDFCGLPLTPSWWHNRGRESVADAVGAATPEAVKGDGSRTAPEPPQFCCLGCRIASAVTRERGQTGAARGMLIRLGLALFLTLNVLAFSMALWTRDVYAVESAPALAGPLEGLLRYLCLLFSLPVFYLLGVPLAENAWQAVRRGTASTDLLLISGVAAAYLYSVVSVVRDDGPIYFEVGCVILFMVTLGRWLEATGRLQAGAALDELQKLLPECVRVQEDEIERSVPIAELRVGDCLRVLPGERIPTDGRLLSPALQIDEQIVTGESRPVLKRAGDSLYGGTLNLDGDCLFEATAEPSQGTLARLIARVREARESKGEYQRLADRLSGVVFPMVIVIALAAGSWHAWNRGLDQGLLAGLSVVLVACPCSLGLATPLAIWSGLGLAARRQVLFRDGESLERLAAIRAVRFDKTGTLTTGQSRVDRFLGDEETDRAAVLRCAITLARSSLHPFSKAIVEFAGHSNSSSPQSLPQVCGKSDFRQIAGRGIVGTFIEGPDGAVCLGNRLAMEDSGFHFPAELQNVSADAAKAGNSLSFVGWAGRVRGVFVFREELRLTSVQAVAWCREAGLDVAVLTGDHADRGRVLSGELGVPVLCELLPDDKVAAIRAVRDRIGPVAMVGDGINDAPALAASDVGIALGCGADVSRDSAAVCLLGDDPLRLIWAIDFARRAVRTIRRNLLWAFGYNAFGIALACTGWLNPAVAAFLMVVSSLLVIGGALRMGVDIGNQQSMGDLRRPHSSGTRAPADGLSITTVAVVGRHLIQPGGSGA